MNEKEKHIILKTLDKLPLSTDERKWMDEHASEDWDSLLTRVDLALENAELNQGDWEDVLGRAEKPIRKRFMFRMAALAASLALILSFNAFYRMYQSDKQGKLITAESTQKWIHSASGAEVELEQGSQIRILDEYQLSLAGNADFVVPNRTGQKPLVIYASGLQILVTGTAFRIEQSMAQTRVELYEGSLDLQFGGEKRDLHEGSILILNGDKKDWNWEVSPLSSEDKSVLRYESMILSSIIQAMSRHYQIELILDETVEDDIFTVNLPADDLDRSLELISDLCHLKVQKIKESTYVLKP